MGRAGRVMLLTRNDSGKNFEGPEAWGSPDRHGFPAFVGRPEYTVFTLY